MGYADDAALLDESREVVEARVNEIARGSLRDADMTINVGKTEFMDVCEQGRVPEATAAEAKGVAKFKCPHAGCNRVFFNIHGCKCHAGKCRWKNFYIVEKIVDVCGSEGDARQKFLIRWQGYGPEHDTWEPRNNLPRGLVKDFLIANGLYDFNWPGARCPDCDKPCKNEQGVKVRR